LGGKKGGPFFPPNPPGGGPPPAPFWAKPRFFFLQTAGGGNWRGNSFPWGPHFGENRAPGGGPPKLAPPPPTRGAGPPGAVFFEPFFPAPRLVPGRKFGKKKKGAPKGRGLGGGLENPGPFLNFSGGLGFPAHKTRFFFFSWGPQRKRGVGL